MSDFELTYIFVSANYVNNNIAIQKNIISVADVEI